MNGMVRFIHRTVRLIILRVADLVVTQELIANGLWRMVGLGTDPSPFAMCSYRMCRAINHKPSAIRSQLVPA